MRLNNLINKELEDRKNETTFKKKELREKIIQQLDSLRDLIKDDKIFADSKIRDLIIKEVNINDEIFELIDKGFFSVEKDLVGFPVSIHKKDNEVRIYSDKEDITPKFSTLIKDISNLSDKDFIIEGILNELNDNAKLYITDCIYLYESLIETNLKYRLSNFDDFKFSDRIDIVPRKTVISHNLKDAIMWASNLKNSNGAIIKKLDSMYGEKFFKF